MNLKQPVHKAKRSAIVKPQLRKEEGRADNHKIVEAPRCPICAESSKVFAHSPHCQGKCCSSCWSKIGQIASKAGLEFASCPFCRRSVLADQVVTKVTLAEFHLCFLEFENNAHAHQLQDFLSSFEVVP